MSKTPEYRAWQFMRSRCTNPADKRFPYYGGRGISICERWDVFQNFLEDMGSRPSPRHSVDRIDVNGGYGPENCRWATMSQQAANRRDTRKLSFDGKTLCCTEWSRLLGIPQATLHRWLFRDGKTLEEIAKSGAS